MDQDGLDLRRYLGVLLGWWWLLLLGPIVVGLVGYGISVRQTPVYRAEATVLVQQSNTATPTLGDIQTSLQLAATYEKLITTRRVLSDVINDPGLQEVDFIGESQYSTSPLPYTVMELSTMVGANAIRDTQLLQIWVRGSDNVETARIANAVANAFIQRTQEDRLSEIARLQSIARAQGIADTQSILAAQFTALSSLTLVESAIVPDIPVEPRTTLNVMVAAILGVMLAIGGAFALERLNDTVQSLERLEALLSRSGIRVPNRLGMVFQWRSKEISKWDIVLETSPRSSYAEAFRQVRANMHFALAAHSGNGVVVTSPGPQEGKSTTTANLGVALALGGTNVILVDADLRRPSMHRFFKCGNEIGLSSYLVDHKTTVEQIVQPTNVDGLEVISSGPIPPNPAELLQSPRMSTLIKALAKRADLVVFDAPPALAVADSVILASQVGSAVLVVEAGGTRVDAARSALEALSKPDVNILGIILNKFRLRRIMGYGNRYGYYYYYRSDGEDSEKSGKHGGRRRWLGWLGSIRQIFSGRP